MSLLSKPAISNTTSDSRRLFKATLPYMAWFVRHNVYLHSLDQWSVTSITLQANHGWLLKSADTSFITHSFTKKSAGLLPAYITLTSIILSPCYWPHSDVQCAYDFRVYLYAQVILDTQSDVHKLFSSIVSLSVKLIITTRMLRF